MTKNNKNFSAFAAELAEAEKAGAKIAVLTDSEVLAVGYANGMELRVGSSTGKEMPRYWVSLQRGDSLTFGFGPNDACYGEDDMCHLSEETVRFLMRAALNA